MRALYTHNISELVHHPNMIWIYTAVERPKSRQYSCGRSDLVLSVFMVTLFMFSQLNKGKCINCISVQNWIHKYSRYEGFCFTSFIGIEFFSHFWIYFFFFSLLFWCQNINSDETMYIVYTVYIALDMMYVGSIETIPIFWLQ